MGKGRDFEGAQALADEMDGYHGLLAAVVTTPIDGSPCRFRHVLTAGDVASEDGRAGARDCLRRLARVGRRRAGGGEQGAEGMTVVAEFLKGLLANCKAATAATSPIWQVAAAMSGMSAAIENAANAVGPAKEGTVRSMAMQRLVVQRRRLDGRFLALEALRSIVPTLESFPPDVPTWSRPQGYWTSS